MITRQLGARLNKPDVRDIPLAMVQSPIPNPVEYISDFGQMSVEDQGQYPKCVGYAEGKIRQYQIWKETGKIVPISAEYLYQVSRLYSGLKKEDFGGAFPRDAAMVTLKSGCATQKTVPENYFEDKEVSITEKIINDALPNKSEGVTFVATNINAICDAIYQNGVVSATIFIDSAWYTYPYGRLKNTANKEGYHRICFFGYRKGLNGSVTLIGRNSWGSTWGKQGNFELEWNDYATDIHDVIAYVDVPQDILKTIRGLGARPEYVFNRNLYANMMNDKDVKKLQDLYKYEGILDNGVISSGNYLSLTVKSTVEFQQRYAIDAWANLLGLGGRTIGPRTRAKLNEICKPTSPKPGKILDWALAIQEHEGFFKPGENKNHPNGSLSWRNNNPGNIRYVGQKRAINGYSEIGKGNFCRFATYADGLAELCDMLIRACTPPTERYSPEMTLLEFFQAYAPSGDGNDPKRYAQTVAKKLEVDTNLQIKYLL